MAYKPMTEQEKRVQATQIATILSTPNPENGTIALWPQLKDQFVETMVDHQHIMPNIAEALEVGATGDMNGVYAFYDKLGHSDALVAESYLLEFSPMGPSIWENRYGVFLGRYVPNGEAMVKAAKDQGERFAYELDYDLTKTGLKVSERAKANADRRRGEGRSESASSQNTNDKYRIR